MHNSLQRVHLFADLPLTVIDTLAGIARLNKYADGALIMMEGDDSHFVFFVLDGIVRAYRTSPDGREQTLIHLHPGDVFNLPTAFEEVPYVPANAVAVDTVEVIAISFADFRHVASHAPELALAVMTDLSLKLHHLTELTHDLSLRNVRARLARFLLTELDTAPRWTHEGIASQIGTVREVVSRTLRAFGHEGLIAVDRQQISLLDHTGLETIAED